MQLSTQAVYVFLSLLASSGDASATGPGPRGATNKRKMNQLHQRRNLKGKKGDSVFKRFVKMYENPPAGVFPGDTIISCKVKLEDDLDCRGDFDCLQLDASDGDVVLDCDGNTIGGYHDSYNSNGIRAQGGNGNTITVKNCIVTGMDICLQFDSGNYNVVLEDVVATGCDLDGIRLFSSGTKTMTDVLTTGNGASGIEVSATGDVILDGVFSCGNGKDGGEDDIRVFTGTITMAEDVTVGTTQGNAVAALVGASTCPVYEPEPMCIQVSEVNTGYCSRRGVRRGLQEYHSQEDIFELIDELSGNPFTAPIVKENALALDQCKALIQFVEKARADDLKLGGIVQEENDPELKNYRVSITPAEFVATVGMESAKELLEFYYESVGAKMAISGFFIRRSFAQKEDGHVNYHTDDYNMIVALNGDDDYDGGHLIYINHEGPYHMVRNAGKAIVNHNGDVHGIEPHNGIRYTFFLNVDMTAEKSILDGTPLGEALLTFDPAHSKQPSTLRKQAV